MAGTANDAPDQGKLSLSQRLKLFNGMLVFIMFYMSLCALNFGYDVGTFSGVQAMQPFGRRFGKFNEETNKYSLPGWLSSVMTATPFLGKAMGCVCCGWIAEKWGRRAAIMILCVTAIGGVTLQTAAVHSAMFTIGRVITFGMTGMAIVVVPIYQAETAPGPLRGMFASTIQLNIAIGTLIASVVILGTKAIDGNAAWLIPIGLQLPIPVIFLALIPLLPESPRWLLSRGRREEAAKNLRKLRNGVAEAELERELQALAYAHHNEQKGSWAEVFDKNNRRRTAVAVLAMFGQQITGQAFASQYNVIFYQAQGFGDQAFTFSMISSCIGLIGIVFVWLYIDGIGRRPVLLVGSFFMAFWLFLLGGMGTMSSYTDAQKRLVVACVMLFGFFFGLSWAPVSYVVVSETAALRVKEKTNLFACVISVLTTFITSFTIPYLVNSEYANLGAKLGFVYGSINVAMGILVYFFIPELKGRTLEEVDQLLASGEPIRKFKEIPTVGLLDMLDNDVAEKGAQSS